MIVDLHHHDESLRDEIVLLYTQEPAETRAAIRRYIHTIPGQITRLAVVVAICLAGTITTRSPTLGMLAIAAMVGTSYLLRFHCTKGRLLADALWFALEAPRRAQIEPSVAASPSSHFESPQSQPLEK